MNSTPERELEPSPVYGEYKVFTAPEQTHTQPEPATNLPPLWYNRDFMLLWSGQLVSVIGSGASQIVFPLLILAITNSPTAAGIAAALTLIPYLVFGLPAGALIDRWDRKRVMIYCDTGRALVLASIPIALAFNALTIWQIYIASFLEGTLFVFFNIAQVAAVTRVVPKAQLAQAVSQNDAAFSTANLLAPSIGTFLYQTFGRAFPFLLDSASYVVSVVSLFFIKTNLQTARKAEPMHLWGDIREGLHWLWVRPLIRFMAFLTGGWNLLAAGQTLMLIVLAKDIGSSDAAIGLIFSIAGIGGILGALVGGRIQRRISYGQAIRVTTWVAALLFPVFLLAPNVIVMGILMGIVFLAGSIYNVVQYSYRISLIPDELQGRVNSSFRLIAIGLQPVGAAVGGVLIEQLGARNAILIYAVIFFGLAISSTLNPSIRNAKQIGHAQA